MPTSVAASGSKTGPPAVGKISMSVWRSPLPDQPTESCGTRSAGTVSAAGLSVSMRGRRRGRDRLAGADAGDGVTIIHAADELGRGGHLIAVEKPDRDEGAAEPGQWLPCPDRVGTETIDGDGANLHHPPQLGDRVGEIVPKAADGMGGIDRPGIVVADEPKPFRHSPGHNRPGFRIGGGAVEPVDGEKVPAADSDAIGVGKVEGAVDEPNPRRRIIHHRIAALDARGEIVGEAERVADLVRGELPDPGERGGDGIVGRAACRHAGADERLEDEHVLADPERTEQHLALDDLAGPRVLDDLAVGPAAGRAIDPVDDVVAYVERVHSFGQHLDPEGVDIAGGLEGLAPPARPFEQGGPDRFGRRGVDIEGDRVADP